MKFYQKKKEKKGRRGTVRCAKLPHRFGKNPIWPKKNGYKNMNVCSGSRGFSRQFSPMIAGPFTIKVRNSKGKLKTMVAKNVENLWQASKVWPADLDQSTPIPPGLEYHLPNLAWFKLRKKSFKDSKGHRRIGEGLKNKKKNAPLYSYWVDQVTGKTEQLSYLEARPKIYCPILEELMLNGMEAYKKVEKMLDNGMSIQFLDYDGVDYIKEGKTLKECFQDASRPFGHSSVMTAIFLGKQRELWPKWDSFSKRKNQFD